MVGQKILKRLFILNVAALKGSGLVAMVVRPGGDGRWWWSDDGARAINLVVVGSICTTAKAQRPTYKQEKRKTDLSRTSESPTVFVP